MAVNLGFGSSEFSIGYRADPPTEEGYNTDPTIFQRGLRTYHSRSRPSPRAFGLSRRWARPS